MAKQGSSQLDWALSLALFLLFVGWFFVFINPNLDAGYDKQTLAKLLKNKLDLDYTGHIETYPLILQTDMPSDNVPVMLPLPFSEQKLRIVPQRKGFVYQGNLIFLANLSKGKRLYWLMKGVNSSTERSYALTATEEWVSTGKNFTAHFEKSLLSHVVYNDELWIINSTFSLNDNRFEPEFFNMTEHDILAKYYAWTSEINFSTIVFAENSQIQHAIELPSGENYSFSFSFLLGNFTNYYSTNLNYGVLTPDTGSVTYTAASITFYNPVGLTFYFDDETTINIVHENGTTLFSGNATIQEASGYKIIFHRGDYRNITKFPYNITLGMGEIITGYSAEKLANMSYDKAAWQFPDERDFQIFLWNTTSAKLFNESSPFLSVGSNAKVATRIYAEDSDEVLLTKEGARQPITLSIRVW